MLGCQTQPRAADAPDQQRGPRSDAISRDPSPAASPAVGPATLGDDIYTPVGNVDEELRLAADYQDINALSAAVNEGQPLPTDAIFAIYQNSPNLRGTGQIRSLRAFARSDAAAQTFPEAAQFFGSSNFLDDTVIDTVTASGSAAGYTPLQQRPALQQAILRILSYASLQQLRAALPRAQVRATDPGTGAPHNVDAAWAIYVGPPDGGSYPRSLGAVARRLETRFHREGSIDRPLREALQRAQRAAANGSASELAAAQRDAEARYAAISYLATAQLLDDAAQAAESGNRNQALVSQAEGLHCYMTIQPVVARADSAADQAVVRYFRADPVALNATSRDAALNALNRTLSALGLTDQDRLTRANFR
jgi:hypothetical protein